MIVSKEVKKIISKKRDGEVITYDDFAKLGNLNSVALALSRLYKSGEIGKLGKGLFYKPKKTKFGELKPSENEILKALLKKNKQGFVSGVSSQNKMGLTTQVPNKLIISGKLERHERVIGNLTIKYRKSDIPFENKNFEHLQVVDAVKNIKRIPDATVSDSLSLIKDKIEKYDEKEIKDIFRIAKKSPPRVRAIIGAIFELMNIDKYSVELYKTLNPLTTYKLKVEDNVLPNKKKWKIK